MVLIPVAVLVLLLAVIFYAAWWEAYKKKTEGASDEIAEKMADLGI